MNYSHNLIAFSGYKRSGKDTGAQFLIDNHNYIKYSFAGALKNACSEIFMFNYNQTEGNKKEEIDERWNINPRSVFQRFGTEIFRDNLDVFFPELKYLKENFWIYRFKLWYKEQIKNNPNIKIVITDVRFQNEADVINEFGGIIIKVKRSNLINNDKHLSETSIDKIKSNFIINNNTTIEDYYNNLKKILLL